MALTLQSTLIPIDSTLSSLNSWLQSTTINNIYGMTVVNNAYFVIIYS